MENDINNLVDFELFGKGDEDEKLQDFIDNLKGDIYKGAYFVVKNDGKVYFGCTEENKLKQERLLYKLREVIEFYVKNYPDIDELKEIAEIMGEDPNKFVEEAFEDEEEDDQ